MQSILPTSSHWTFTKVQVDYQYLQFIDTKILQRALEAGFEHTDSWSIPNIGLLTIMVHSVPDWTAFLRAALGRQWALWRGKACMKERYGARKTPVSLRKEQKEKIPTRRAKEDLV